MYLRIHGKLSFVSKKKCILEVKHIYVKKYQACKVQTKCLQETIDFIINGTNKLTRLNVFNKAFMRVAHKITFSPTKV